MRAGSRCSQRARSNDRPRPRLLLLLLRRRLLGRHLVQLVGAQAGQRGVVEQGGEAAGEDGAELGRAPLAAQQRPLAPAGARAQSGRGQGIA